MDDAGADLTQQIADRVPTGEQYAETVRVPLSDLAQKLRACNAGHDLIADDDVGLAQREQAARFSMRRGRADLVVFAEHVPEKVETYHFVVQIKNCSFHLDCLKSLFCLSSLDIDPVLDLDVISLNHSLDGLAVNVQQPDGGLLIPLRVRQHPLDVIGLHLCQRQPSFTLRGG